MIQKLPFICSDHQSSQTNHIQSVLNEPNAFWSKHYLEKCENWFFTYFSKPFYFLDSCTEAVNTVGLISELKQGDEVIMPSYTHVSSVLALANRGVIPVFVDISLDSLCIDPTEVEKAITDKTRMVISVNYGSWSPDYDQLKSLCTSKGLLLMEDNAHGLGASHDGKHLGRFGDFSVFSFERQKNITSQEGGGLLINAPSYSDRSTEIIHLGTNRTAFDKGDAEFFEWISKGTKASFTEFQAAYLLPQLESLQLLTTNRVNAWKYYYDKLKVLENEDILLPQKPNDSHNGHVFYLILKNQKMRNKLMNSLAEKGIEALPHYYPLHRSKYGLEHGRTIGSMENTDRAGLNLLRLPMFNGITNEQQELVTQAIHDFLKI